MHLLRNRDSQAQLLERFKPMTESTWQWWHYSTAPIVFMLQFINISMESDTEQFPPRSFSPRSRPWHFFHCLAAKPKVHLRCQEKLRPKKNCRAIIWRRWSYFIFCPIPCFLSLLRSRQHSLAYNFNSFYITDRGATPTRGWTLYWSKGSKEKRNNENKYLALGGDRTHDNLNVRRVLDNCAATTASYICSH